MKHALHTKIAASQYKTHTGEVAYDWPLPPEAWLNVTVRASESFLALLETATGELVPLSSGECNFSGKYHLCGFQTLWIRCKKSCLLAIDVGLSTKASLDPLDYQPVDIGPLPSVQEKMLMRQAIEQELQSRGILIDDDDYDPEEEADLEFFDEDDITPTLFNEMDEVPSMSEEEEDAEEKPPQPEDENETSEVENPDPEPADKS